MNADGSATLGRLTLGAMGALAGLSFWLVVDVLADRLVDQPRVILFLASLTGVFFTAGLAMTGPITLSRAVAASAALALAVSGLVTWASLRFDTVDDYIATVHPLAAMAFLGLIPLPFVIARGRQGGWFGYPALFANSWDIVVRYAAAWVFVALVWGVLMLSDALFGLVGLTIIEDLLDIEPVPYVLTGLTLGVALAVVNELSEYVSPYLVLRLLRLLLPVVLVVVLIFLLALPFRGLSELFGSFSAATTLMAMAMGATTLVTTALDADDESAVKSVPMRVSAQLMALVLPALGVLAGVAIQMRVEQYGWSPDRLAAATLAALVLAYGAAYSLAVILRRGWGRHIRRVNVVMALVVVAVSALWLTPVFHPQRIATASQIARFKAGKVAADKLDLWTIGREWGRAGADGLVRLAALDDPELTRRLAALEAAPTRHAFETGRSARESQDGIALLEERMPVLPEPAAVPQAVFDGLAPWEVTEYAAACARRTGAGNPGCLLLVVELSARGPGPEVVIAALGPNDALRLVAYVGREGSAIYDRREAAFLDRGQIASGGAGILDGLFAGRFGLSQIPAWTLDLAGRRVFFGP